MNEDKPAAQFFETYLGSTTTGVIIAAMLAGFIVFFTKGASYPEQSQLQTDYFLAGFVFLSVYIYASARVARDWVIGGVFAFGLMVVGIMSLFSSLLTSYERNGRMVVRLESLALPFGAALILIALLVFGRWFFSKLDEHIEKTDQTIKRKNAAQTATYGFPLPTDAAVRRLAVPPLEAKHLESDQLESDQLKTIKKGMK
jgi:hypothetical protein